MFSDIDKTIKYLPKYSSQLASLLESLCSET